MKLTVGGPEDKALYSPVFQSKHKQNSANTKVVHQMPNVKVKENEPFEVAMRRFKRSCEKAGVLTETRRREFYEKPTTERKRKLAAAVKRHQKKLSKEAARRVRLF